MSEQKEMKPKMDEFADELSFGPKFMSPWQLSVLATVDKDHAAGGVKESELRMEYGI